MNTRNLFKIFTAVLIPLLILTPAVAFGFTFQWESNPADQSLNYLGQLFGPVGNVFPNAPGNALIGQLFTIFNIAVLSIGSIVVSYTIILSTINTAQEGEVMGKKFSSLWIPLRSAVGLAFLIPTASGYSMLQVLMINIVVYGVASANQLWAKVVDAMFTSGGPGVVGSISLDRGLTISAANSIFNSMVCAEVINTNPSCSGTVGTNVVQPYVNSNNSSVIVGVQNNTNYGAVCGGLQASQTVPANVDPASWYAVNEQAMSAAAIGVMGAAQEVANVGTLDPNAIPTAINSLNAITSAAPRASASPTSQNATNAKQYGWLYAGSYYIVMVMLNNTNNVSYTPPTTIAPNLATLSTACMNAVSSKMQQASNLSTRTPVATNQGGQLILPQVHVPNQVQSLFSGIASKIQILMFQFMHYLTSNSPGGPVASLAKVGSDCLRIAEDIWFYSVIVGFLVMTLACIYSGLNPLCFAVGVIISLAIPILTFVISLLWIVGGLLGVYVPLIPYIVFTFTALGWIILVIEAVVAAPIVAIGLVSPAGEHLGKAAPAVLLIVNVFLRPSLMVIGLMAAVYLVNAVVTMLNYGFNATLESSTGQLGIFGCIAVITLYGGTIILLIKESFNLIYILPDRIIRWLGGQEEKSRVESQVKEAEAAHEKGHKMGGDAMKSSAQAVGARAKARMAKAKGGGEEEG